MFQASINGGGSATSEALMFREPLTPRQFQVLDLIAEGLTDRQIARQLGIARKTAECHAAFIFSRLDVSNRTAAALIYLKHKKSIKVRNRNYKNQRD